MEEEVPTSQRTEIPTLNIFLRQSQCHQRFYCRHETANVLYRMPSSEVRVKNHQPAARGMRRTMTRQRLQSGQSGSQPTEEDSLNSSADENEIKLIFG